MLSFVSELLSPSSLLKYLDLSFPVTTVFLQQGLRKTKQSRVSCFLNHCRYPQCLQSCCGLKILDPPLLHCMLWYRLIPLKPFVTENYYYPHYLI